MRLLSLISELSNIEQMQIPSCLLSTSSAKSSQTDKNVTANEVQIIVKDGVRQIILNRPDKKNALTPEMFKGIFVGVSAANNDDATVVVSLTGMGDYFTSGMDMMPRPKPVVNQSELNSKQENKEDRRGRRFSKFLLCFLDCKKPLIGLVNGPTVGVGVTMLGLFDAVYASDAATFHTSFTKFGLPPEMASTYTFPRIMGYSKASKLLMFNQKMTANEAYQSGLVSRVIPHQQFNQKTKALLQEYGQLPVKSLMYSKELVRGRQRELISEVSETEQSFFDPELAKKVIMQFMAKRNQDSTKPA